MTKKRKVKPLFGRIRQEECAMNTLVNDGKFLTVAATPTAEQAAVAGTAVGVSDEAMPGAYRVIIGRVHDQCVCYYYNVNDDPRLRVALRAQAERWVAPHEG